MFTFFDPCNSCSISTLHSPWLNLTKRASVSRYKKDKKPKRATSLIFDASFLVGWLSQKAKKLVMSAYCNWRTSQSIRTVCSIQVCNILLHFGGPMKVLIQAFFVVHCCYHTKWYVLCILCWSQTFMETTIMQRLSTFIKLTAIIEHYIFAVLFQ